jgi:hypothetical protein
MAAQTEEAIKNFLISQGHSERQIANSLSLIGALAQAGTANLQKAYYAK